MILSIVVGLFYLGGIFKAYEVYTIDFGKNGIESAWESLQWPWAVGEYLVVNCIRFAGEPYNKGFDAGHSAGYSRGYQDGYETSQDTFY